MPSEIGPSFPIGFELLKDAMLQLSRLPVEMWREIADKVEGCYAQDYLDWRRTSGIREEIISSKDGMLNVSSGGLAGAGNLVFGVLGNALTHVCVCVCVRAC
jgi:hypothetical protein